MLLIFDAIMDDMLTVITIQDWCDMSSEIDILKNGGYYK